MKTKSKDLIEENFLIFQLYLFTIHSSLLTPKDLLLSHNGAFLTDPLVARNGLAGAAHTRAEAASHSLLKAELSLCC